MLAKVKSYALDGLVGYRVDTEVDINSGLPGYELVGLASTATKESKERVRSAMKNSGLLYPMKRITVNLAPADTKKEGSGFDLPIAIGLLAASEQIVNKKYKDFVFIGELGLDGKLRHVNGIMPLLLSAYQDGETRFVIPSQNAKEASFIEGIEVYAMDRLSDVVAFLSGVDYNPVPISSFASTCKVHGYGVDFCNVKGQSVAKRALEIAVSGGHNVLMIGPPGAGKTMLAKCVPTIMPDMNFQEAVEVTKIHSVSGILDPGVGIVTTRPFRTPHHTTTVPTLVGGGNKATPGEVSLAHNGVLFLDEMPEYSRRALETLRQPLEDRRVTVARVARTVEYPSNFMLIASMNPCPCGNYGSKTQVCKCSPQQIHNYVSKLSGPLLDRIDLQIEVDSVLYEEFRGKEKPETSAEVKARINRVRAIQAERFKDDGIRINAEMEANHLEKYCTLDQAGERLLQKAFDKLNLSARGTTRILKVARTIADIDGSQNIESKHIAEAIQYRGLDRKYNR
ncbi:MAG: YifB family Mg chelatase-like AAA ATPase [Clostridia bacterium]|nr:YifB family Mg chelatase-like AAA ATPase [Clostridia bacterium]